jgi:hypothetical protein
MVIRCFLAMELLIERSISVKATETIAELQPAKVRKITDQSLVGRGTNIKQAPTICLHSSQKNAF